MWTSLFLEILKFVARTRIHHKAFASFPKISRNCLWWSHFLIKTQGFKSTVQNSAKLCQRKFHEEHYQKNEKLARIITV